MGQHRKVWASNILFGPPKVQYLKAVGSPNFLIWATRV